MCCAYCVFDKKYLVYSTPVSSVKKAFVTSHPRCLQTAMSKVSSITHFLVRGMVSIKCWKMLNLEYNRLPVTSNFYTNKALTEPVNCDEFLSCKSILDTL